VQMACSQHSTARNQYYVFTFRTLRAVGDAFSNISWGTFYGISTASFVAEM
jgi:hypothetical protein